MTSKVNPKTIVLDGFNLTPEDLYAIGYEDNIFVKISDDAIQRVKEGREVVNEVLNEGRVVYGINTGFGLFSEVRINKQNLEKLQINLIRSHASGVGEYLSIHQSRMLLGLRINVLSKGHSGITLKTLKQLLNALNKNCISCIPLKGTVGASGDLAPLAHLALGLLGEGEMWDLSYSPPKPNKAAKILKRNNLPILELKAKEGLALINGTQFITSLGVEALIRGENIANQTDIVAAMSLEALRGTTTAYSKLIHNTRPHSGQLLSAGRLRCLLHNELKKDTNISEIRLSHKHCGKVQDAYTLRCTPQVNGIVHDTLSFCRKILTTELNSATDNPMIFNKKWSPPNSKYYKHDILSGGNFHGEYPAKVLDYLGICIAELGNMSERRIERLNNPDLSNLPAFLINNGGLNSGYMIPHCTAAALVSENKVLCHPSSVDSLSTSAAKEDHVSMGGFSARKAIQIVGNVETIIGIELLCACQAFDLLKPLKSTKPLQNIHEYVRKFITYLDNDRFLKPDIDKIKNLLFRNQIWKQALPFLPPKYHSIENVQRYKASRISKL